VALVACGILILANTAAYRQAEAWSTWRVVDAVVGRGTYLQPNSGTFFVGLETKNAVGLRIDQLCSTGGIAGVLIIFTGVLLIAAGLRVRRALLGLGAMLGLLLVVNVVRLTALSWTVTTWGLTGWFEWLHLYGGAAISMVAIAVGLALYLRLIRRSVPEPIV